MATKPSSILGYNPSRSACVTVPAGKMAVGFLPGEKPPAQYLGDIFERVDRWLEYVADGAWTGNTTITGTFGVTGATSITGTLSASGLITATSGLTAAVNQHVTVSGTGLIKHGNKKIVVAASAFQINATAGSIAVGSIPSLVTRDRWEFSGSTSVNLVGAVDVPVGATIRTIKWWFNKGGQAAALGMFLRKDKPNLSTSDPSTLLSTTNDTTSGSTDVSSTASSINYLVEDDAQVQLVVSAGHVAHQFLFAVVTYDQT